MNKPLHLLGFAAFAILISCSGNKNTGELPVVDVTRSYPEKALVFQDFAEVEYIPLETGDDFIIADVQPEYVDDDYIIMVNRNQGDIMLFDRRTGKGIRRINHQGKGPGEYPAMWKIYVARDNGEIYVEVSDDNILVYDLNGTFKRRHDLSGHRYEVLAGYGPGRILAYEQNLSGENGLRPFVLLSGEDMSVTKHIPVPLTERVVMRIIPDNIPNVTLGQPLYPIHRTGDGFILSEFSADTIYRLDPENDALTPVMVRTPAVGGMDVPASLTVAMETDRYFFMQTVKREFDGVNWDKIFPKTFLLYDKRSGDIYSQKLTDENYGGQKSYNIAPENTNNYRSGYPPHTAVFGLAALQLTDDLEAGNLSGKLKDIASGLKEDDNPVLMIVKFK